MVLGRAGCRIHAIWLQDVELVQLAGPGTGSVGAWQSHLIQHMLQLMVKVALLGSGKGKSVRFVGTRIVDIHANAYCEQPAARARSNARKGHAFQSGLDHRWP